MPGFTGKTGVIFTAIAAGTAAIYLSAQNAAIRRASIITPALGDFHVRTERSGGGI